MKILNIHSTMVYSKDDKVCVALETDAARNSVISNTMMANNLELGLSLELNATTYPDQYPRLFWDQNKLVRLVHSSTDCSYLLDGFSLDVQDSFKQAVLQYSASGQIGLVKLFSIISAMRTCAKKYPTTTIDVNWVAKCFENRTFRNEKKQIRLFLQYWREKYAPAKGIISLDALKLLAQAAGAGSTADNVNSDDPEKVGSPMKNMKTFFISPGHIMMLQAINKLH